MALANIMTAAWLSAEDVQEMTILIDIPIVILNVHYLYGNTSITLVYLSVSSLKIYQVNQDINRYVIFYRYQDRYV